jgi:UDP-N-acetylmuramyl pentapeptide phosphotransferase/UDP-N-acetylglucosamine-1-phosphate transferase
MALRLGGVSLADSTKILPGAVTRMSGMAVVFGVMVPLVALLPEPSPLLPAVAIGKHRFIALVAGAAAAATLGALEEHRPLAAIVWLPALLATATGMWLAGFRVGGAMKLPVWIDFPASVLWITGAICLLRLADRRRGLAAAAVFCVALANIVLSLATGNAPGALLASMVAGAALVPAAFNWGGTASSKILPMFLGHVFATTFLVTGL